VSAKSIKQGIQTKQHTPGETASLSYPSLTAPRHTVGADGWRGRVGRPLRPKLLLRLGSGITKKSASASDLRTLIKGTKKEANGPLNEAKKRVRASCLAMLYVTFLAPIVNHAVHREGGNTVEQTLT
jgi:hypothetical protein